MPPLQSAPCDSHNLTPALCRQRADISQLRLWCGGLGCGSSFVDQQVQKLGHGVHAAGLTPTAEYASRGALAKAMMMSIVPRGIV